MARRESMPQLSLRHMSAHIIYEYSKYIIPSSGITHRVRSQKMDLGACPKSHTERLKTEFLAAREADPNNPIFNRFQMEYEANIFAFVDECDRRIRAAHRRLEKTPEENAKTTNLVWFLFEKCVYHTHVYVAHRCVRLLRLSWPFKEEQRKSKPSVGCSVML